MGEKKEHVFLPDSIDIQAIRSNEKVSFNIRNGLANDIDMCLGWFEEGRDAILVSGYSKHEDFWCTSTVCIYTEPHRFARWLRLKLEQGADVITTGDDMHIMLNGGDQWPKNLMVQVIKLNQSTNGDMGEGFKLMKCDARMTCVDHRRAQRSLNTQPTKEA